MGTDGNRQRHALTLPERTFAELRGSDGHLLLGSIGRINANPDLIHEFQAELGLQS